MSENVIKRREVVMTLEIKKVEGTERDYYVRVKEWGANCPVAESMMGAVEKAIPAILKHEFTNQAEMDAALDDLVREFG